MTATERLVVVHPNPEVLAQAAAARLLTGILDVQSQRAPVHIVLTGGTVGIKTLAAVATNPVRDAIDWSHVHVWWGDERFLPTGDPERNETQARAALLSHLDTLPESNIHPMPAARPDEPGFDSDRAAEQYAAELTRFAAADSDVPQFDVLLLGMGPDAHVASLFPHHPSLAVDDRPTTGVTNSPKPPPTRVSLTFKAIQSAREVWIVASGAEKAAAAAAGLAGSPVQEAPVAGAYGRERTLWLLDSAAAAGVLD